MSPFRFQRSVAVCCPADKSAFLRRATRILHAMVCAVVCGFAGSHCQGTVDGFVEGMPLTMLYPLEEIGCTTSGLQLLNDAHDRVVVAQQDELFALNDATWQRLRGEASSGLSFHRVACGPDGVFHYTVFGAWGVLRKNHNGELGPVCQVPADAPAWTRSCDFRDILCTDKGTLFWGQDGVVFIDGKTGIHTYFPIGGTSCVFPLKDQFIVATFHSGLFVLNFEAKSWTPTNILDERLPAVISAAGDGTKALLLATTEGKFLTLRDGYFSYVTYGEAEHFPGPISATIALPEGGFAASVAGYGLLFIDKAGVLARVLNASDFRGIAALQSTEPGVLWAVTERGVLKIMHQQPFTAYGRDQGLLVSWPQIMRWRGRTIVSSGGRVFQAYTKSDERGTHFKQLNGQPDSLNWGIAVVGESLLIGGGNGVYETGITSAPNQVLAGINVARLVAIDPTTCLVIATDCITAIRRENGKWVECTERVSGVGYPYVALAGNGCAWLELGMNRLAQISIVDGHPRVRLLENFAWKEKCWVNVSLLGDTVVLSGSDRVPMFLNAQTLEPVEAPELRNLIDRVPFTLQRFKQDDTGTLWISHTRGLFSASPVQGRYEPDYNAFSGIKEAVPLIQGPFDGELWASTEKSLYRLDTEKSASSLPPPIHPVLISLKDSRAGAVLSPDSDRRGDLGSFRYAQNSLQLNFFAGSYAWVRPFSYEYRLGTAPWKHANAGSSVFLTDLSEGNYAFEIRAMDTFGPVGEVAAFQFAVQAPWYRTWAAFVAYPFATLLLIYLGMRYSAHLHKVRLAELERKVDVRTSELRTTMECLREETTTSATLAERNRLAGEIHDSLEQGFAGLLLQLESTSRLPDCGGPVRTGLTAAINMVQYCRDELRNAVRGLHSPVLDTASLETAIRRIATQLSPLSGFVTVQVEGSPRRINPAIEHHLLRIAQESLGNVVKHAGASKVEVVLGFTTQDVSLSVSDNGCGFNRAALRGSECAHHGLPSFESRARKIGGTVTIDSLPGQGTTVRLVVPEISSDGEQS